VKPLYLRDILCRFATALADGRDKVGVFNWELRRAGLTEITLAAQIGPNWIASPSASAGQVIFTYVKRGAA
jgi:hypothetical protein